MQTGSLKLHWRAPLQTKGFLRIIEIILAIFAFSLVAGFHVQGHIRCTKDAAAAVTLNIKYPFTHYTYTNGSNTELFEYEPLLYSKAGSASQLFVAWGVLSMLYCFIALAVYVVFTANEKMENLVDILVYVDLAFNLIWVLVWFIACIEWSVAFTGMRSSIGTFLHDFEFPSGCSPNQVVVRDQSNYAQAAIASIFGFLNLLVWGANTLWIFIDTAFFIKWRARKQMNDGM